MVRTIKINTNYLPMRMHNKHAVHIIKIIGGSLQIARFEMSLLNQFRRKRPEDRGIILPRKGEALLKEVIDNTNAYVGELASELPPKSKRRKRTALKEELILEVCIPSWTNSCHEAFHRDLRPQYS